MFVLRKLTLTFPIALLSAVSIGLTSCSVIPFPQNWNAAEEAEAPAVKPMAQLPRVMPDTQKNTPIPPASQRLNGAAIDNLAQQAKDAKPKLPANAQLADLDNDDLESVKSGAKTKNSAQAMAQNLIKGRKASTQTARMKEEPGNFIPNTPKTYRLDGPQQMAITPQNMNPPQNMNTPQEVYQQNYNQQAYYNQQMGYQNQGYPRSPAQFQPPQNMSLNMMPQNGFMPPDPSPVAQKPGNDPKAVMEAVERMRARQAIQPNRLTSNSEEQTGTLAAQNRQADPSPKGPLTFIQFERGSTLLNASGQKSLATMLAPHARLKKAKIYLNAGLGGEGEAYTKLSQANQRAQAISERIPAQFEIIRRFDPGLPNESVRLFVVE